jgi:hypothetical protein
VDAARRLGAVVAVVVVAVVAGAAPASAETDLQAEAGYVDGQIVPGRPVPVRVQIRSDQLMTGSLTVTPHTLGDPGEAVTTAVEVAGGSVKDFLVVVPTEWDGNLGPSEMRVSLDAGDEASAVTATLSWDGRVEVVGLLPGLVSQAPEPTPLPMDLGRAVFSQLGDQELTTSGALGPLGTIVAGPDGLADLPPDAVRNILDWVEAGGQLLVDAPPGTPLVGVPDEWQPAGVRAAAGEGWVRLTDGAAARGQWASIVEPTRQFSARELSQGGFCCFQGVPDAIARDAGLRVPDVGWLLGFLVAYVVVVGPLTFVLLRRTRRTGLAWVAVPLVAVLFTGGAFVAGSGLRGQARAAHGSVVQSSPLGDRVVSHVGLVSRDGGDPTAFFPAGWDAGGLDLGPISAMDDGPVDPGAANPAITMVDDEGRRGVELPLSSGDFGVVTGRGRIDGDSPLAVTATAAADGSVTGTVTNASDLDLEAVIVVVAGQVADVGDLAAGAVADWALDADPDALAREDPWAVIEAPWSDAIGEFDTPDPDSVVNYSVFADEIAGDVDAYPPGLVVAAGWTPDWSPPVDTGSRMAGGRTAFVARDVVTAAPGAVPAAAVRREFVRGPGATRFDPPIQIPDWGDAVGAVVRFVLPDGTDPATPLVLDAGAAVVQAEVWNGQAWVSVSLAEAAAGAAAAGGVAVDLGEVESGSEHVAATIVGPAAPAQPPPPPPPVVIGGPGFDPAGPARQASLPEGVVHGGAVYVRVAMSPDSPRLLLDLRGAS